MWFSGRNGLDRWNGGQVTAFRRADGLPDSGPHSLFQDHDGRVWAFSPHGSGYFDDGRFVRVRNVPDEVVTSIAEDGDTLWLSTDRGLVHLSNGRLVDQVPWARLGGRIGMTVARDRDYGSLWLGFYGGGVSYFKDGQVRRSYTAADGLGQGNVSDLRFRADGSLWAATENGISVIRTGTSLQ